jgi:phosphoribosylamine---glycine ligase
MDYKVLVIGAGGREHALCWKLAQSDFVAKIYCAPGNAGTANEIKTENVPLSVSDFPNLVDFAKAHQIDLTVVGPDNPLADGIVDIFLDEGLRIFGPSRQAARLEGSKVFAKQFMKFHELPTTRFEVFENARDGLEFCKTNDWARVIKVDGLALGKGVYVCDSLQECETALTEIFTQKRFGESGSKVVIEERLFGPEISLMVMCDGTKMLPLASSQDYKRRFEENKGPNTGGMGVYSPVPIYQDYEARIQAVILDPLEEALRVGDIEYKGLLYLGLMIHEEEPYILEFNARFGDPEAQCLLPRLENDLYLLMEACVEGTLSQYRLSWTDKAGVCVVLTADTYPESGSKDVPIQVDTLPPGVRLFHAGTKLTGDGMLVTNGGRVLNVVALGDTHELAAKHAYQAIERIQFDGMAFRRDIAKDVTLCLSK